MHAHSPYIGRHLNVQKYTLHTNFHLVAMFNKNGFFCKQPNCTNYAISSLCRSCVHFLKIICNPAEKDGGPLIFRDWFVPSYNQLVWSYAMLFVQHKHPSLPLKPLQFFETLTWNTETFKLIDSTFDLHCLYTANRWHWLKQFQLNINNCRCN